MQDSIAKVLTAATNTGKFGKVTDELFHSFGNKSELPVFGVFGRATHLSNPTGKKKQYESRPGFPVYVMVRKQANTHDDLEALVKTFLLQLATDAPRFVVDEDVSENLRYFEDTISPYDILIAEIMLNHVDIFDVTT